MTLATIEIPTPTEIKKPYAAPPSTTCHAARTSFTFTGAFHEEERLLSGKPIRRPDRQRPAMVPMPTEDEKAALQALQTRMPARERIQSLIEKRPARDPWLDDEYDWRP